MGLHSEAERSQWLSLVQEQEKSGCGQKEFCQERSLSLNTFSYYRGQYLEQKSSPRVTPQKVQNTFVEISMTPMVLEPFRLNFPNGVLLTLPQQFDNQRLKQLVEVLRVC